jgi:catechol 2,3-dioxygenase-like lactoylglutathione lyase family enzyme
MATRKKASKKKTKTAAKATRKTAAKRSAKPARASAKKAVAAKKTAPAGPFSLQAPSLTVNDARTSVDWYVNVLGFTIKQTWEREGVFRGGELQAGPVTLYIGQDDWAKGRDRVKGEGLRLWWYTRQNIDKMAAGIKSRGGVLESEPKDEYGRRSFTLVDPTGYKITVASEK